MLAAAVLVTGGMSLHSYLSEQRAKNEYDAIRQEVVAEPAAGETQEEIAEKNYPELQIDFAELIRTNPDFRGWLYFPALDISYPVVQGEDNDYYLKHSFEGGECECRMHFHGLWGFSRLVRQEYLCIRT